MFLLKQKIPFFLEPANDICHCKQLFMRTFYQFDYVIDCKYNSFVIYANDFAKPWFLMSAANSTCSLCIQENTKHRETLLPLAKRCSKDSVFLWSPSNK